MAHSERKLVAILAADVVGYSRLMEVDESGTLARLKTHRLELIDPAIAKHRGRIIKTTGDGLLVEFQSVVDAVECAAEIQTRMARRNADVSPARAIQLRIGINLGDVIVEDGDIFGDVVNVAARLEALAEPGGVCVSAVVRDQVGDRLDTKFEDRGEHSVKNITRPIRIYRVVPGAGATTSDAAPGSGKTSVKPSIAVLPFANMSGDPEQEFFVDGLTEDIITELSRFRDLLVISRNSVFVHKGKPVKVQEVGREFAVDSVDEEFLLGIAAHVGEWEHRDGRLNAGFSAARGGVACRCARAGHDPVDTDRPGDLLDAVLAAVFELGVQPVDRKSTRLNSS